MNNNRKLPLIISVIISIMITAITEWILTSPLLITILFVIINILLSVIIIVSKTPMSLNQNSWKFTNGLFLGIMVTIVPILTIHHIVGLMNLFSISSLILPLLISYLFKAKTGYLK